MHTRQTLGGQFNGQNTSNDFSKISCTYHLFLCIFFGGEFMSDFQFLKLQQDRIVIMLRDTLYFNSKTLTENSLVNMQMR